MVRTNYFKVSTVLMAVMAAALVAMLLVAQKPAAGLPIGGDLCLSGPEICPPETSITSGPLQDETVYTDSVSFGFSSNESGSTFECKLDIGAFERCTSPQPYTGLSDGSHAFQVRAIDPQGKVDATPESRTWMVDTTQPPPDNPPETSLPSAEGGFSNGPPQGSTSRFGSASFQFYANETGSTFECKLDESNWETCTSPKGYTDLSDGSHTFQVRAIDPAGNVDPTPESRQWFVDTTPPDTTITSHPSDPSDDSTPTFEFTSNETPSSMWGPFECRYPFSWSGGNWVKCSSPHTISGVSTSGTYTFEVRTVDDFNRPDPTQASYTWTFTADTTAPKVDTTTPDGGATGVAPTANVEATFSEDMDPNTVTASTFTLTRQGSSTPVAATLSDPDGSARTVRLDPGSDLAPNTTYTASIRGGDTGVKDRAGNALAQDYNWTFATAPPVDTTKPKVGTTTPAGGATGVARNASPTAAFSERMDPASLTKSTFKLYKCPSTTSTNCTTQVTNATVAPSTDGLKATLNPYGASSTLLASSSRYKAVVTTGAKDVANNPLDQNPSAAGNQQKAWYFTTGRT